MNLDYDVHNDLKSVLYYRCITNRYFKFSLSKKLFSCKKWYDFFSPFM